MRCESLRKNVTVLARMLTTGNMVPLEIVWDDGRVFKIDKVLSKEKRASLKGGGKGTRYTVRVMGQERYLFFDDGIWFVEV